MRGRGRGRGGGSSLPGLTPDTLEGQEATEDNRQPPPDYPELWNEKYPFKTIDPCVGNEPYKARMAIKIQSHSKKSAYYLEPEEPAPEIDTWMNRNRMHSKPIKQKPSQTINFHENLFPFELLPKKMQNTIRKSKLKGKSDEDEMRELLKKEKEAGGYVEDADEDKEKNEGERSMDEEGNEDMQEEANKEGIDDDDPELIEGSWMRNDDDSLGEEDDSEGEAMF
jgi:hypothetical protein